MWENQCKHRRDFIIFSNNRFYRKIYIGTGRKNLRLFSETFWHPREFAFSTASTLHHFMWLCATLVPLYIIPATHWSASPSSLFIRVPASLFRAHQTVANLPLPPPYNSPSEIDILLFEESIFLEILNICWCVSKSSLILFLLMNQRPRLSP